ncbi:hypothetical protein C8R45DRAFT_943859 [Mycena sanguinolenta]|nr:hypothetical protein C8R45DRAFT_943859 [Mycena sanguinolenta]
MAAVSSIAASGKIIGVQPKSSSSWQESKAASLSIKSLSEAYASKEKVVTDQFWKKASHHAGTIEGGITAHRKGVVVEVIEESDKWNGATKLIEVTLIAVVIEEQTFVVGGGKDDVGNGSGSASGMGESSEVSVNDVGEGGTNGMGLSSDKVSGDEGLDEERQQEQRCLGRMAENRHLGRESLQYKEAAETCRCFGMRKNRA